MSKDTFLVTRLEKQAQPLLSLLSKAGVKAMAVPVIEISSRALDKSEQGFLTNLTSYDFVFFISANAVDESIALIKKSGGFSQKTQVVVVGPATESALAAHGIKTDIISSTVFNSEGLLAEKDLQQVSAKKILIFRGVGGRTLLSETLTSRGAKVDSIASYKRNIPRVGNKLILNSLPKLRAIVVMSNESLDNLCTLLGDPQQLKDIILVVISERTASQAKALGLSAIIAKSPSDQDVFHCLMREI